jgi:hypothetical protein
LADDLDGITTAQRQSNESAGMPAHQLFLDSELSRMLFLLSAWLSRMDW